MLNGLSIVIVNYNTHAITCACISSILSSKPGNLEFEVILVDNGSDEQNERPFYEIFPNIVYVRSKVNVGFARGNNLGISFATKPYVLLLNSDTIITDGAFFMESINIVRNYDDRIVLTPALLTEDGTPQVAYGYLPRLSLEVMLSLFIHKLLPRRQRDDLLIRFVPDTSRVIDKGYITATCYLFPRKLLKKLPGERLYDQTFLYGEELYWASQWMHAGVKMYYAANLSVVHLVGRSFKQKQNYDGTLRRRYQIRAEHRYLRWRYARITVVLIYFLRIIRFLLIAPFNKAIRERLRLLLEVIFTRNYDNGSQGTLY